MKPLGKCDSIILGVGSKHMHFWSIPKIADHWKEIVDVILWCTSELEPTGGLRSDFGWIIRVMEGLLITSS